MSAVNMPFAGPTPLRTTSGRWLAAYFLWCFGMTLHRGFGLEGLPFVLLGIWLVPWSAGLERRGSGREEARSFRSCALVGLPLVGVTALIHTPGLGQATVLALTTFVVTCLIVATAWIVLRTAPRPGFRWTLLLAALYFCSGALVISGRPTPHIDAYVFEQNGAARFLQGRNPYSEIYPNIYTPEESRGFMGREAKVIDYYVYPPASLFATTAGYLAGGDIRYAMLAAQTVFGLLLWRIASLTTGATWPAMALAAVYYLFPINLYLLDSAWTDPLVSCALAFFFWTLVTKRARLWGWALGLFFSMKQYSVVAVPLLLGQKWASSRRLTAFLGALALTALIFVPFVLWNVRDLLNDLVLEVWRTPIRTDEMSLSALVFKTTGWAMPGSLSFVAALAVSAWLVRKAPEGPLGLALGMFAVYLAFFLFGKQAAPNYYVFLAQVMLLCIGLQGGREWGEGVTGGEGVKG
jgi:hypothetical protein